MYETISANGGLQKIIGKLTKITPISKYGKKGFYFPIDLK